MPEDIRVLTTEDIVALVRKLVELPAQLGVPEDSKDFAAEAIGLLARPDPQPSSTSTSTSATAACARSAS